MNLTQFIFKNKKKLSSYSKLLITKDSSYKISSLKNYLYENIFMDNYGDPILDDNKNLLGYKIDENKFVSVITYKNSENLLCNSVSVRELGETDLSLKHNFLREWVDTKVEGGFIREFNKIKYFYDTNNKLINVEKVYTYPTLPIIKKDIKLDHRIGTIDF